MACSRCCAPSSPCRRGCWGQSPSCADPGHTPVMPVFTIGYEGRSLDQFLADLGAQGVTLLADVRDAPVSRKPGFSKSPLAAALQQAGISYRHIRALGCPKPIRDACKQDGDWARYTRAFM